MSLKYKVTRVLKTSRTRIIIEFMLFILGFILLIDAIGANPLGQALLGILLVLLASYRQLAKFFEDSTLFKNWSWK